MPAGSAFQREVQGFLERCGPLAAACLGFAVVAFFRGGNALPVGYVVMFVAGALCGAFLLLSWRLYQPMLSWLLWVVPGTVLVVTASEFVVLPFVDNGEVSLVTAMYLLVGSTGLGFFGLLFFLRSHVRRWFGI